MFSHRIKKTKQQIVKDAIARLITYLLYLYALSYSNEICFQEHQSLNCLIRELVTDVQNNISRYLKQSLALLSSKVVYIWCSFSRSLQLFCCKNCVTFKLILHKANKEH